MRNLLTMTLMLTLMLLPLAGTGMAVSHATVDPAAVDSALTGSALAGEQVESARAGEQSEADPHCATTTESQSATAADTAHTPPTAEHSQDADCCADGLCGALQCDQLCGHCVNGNSANGALTNHAEEQAAHQAQRLWWTPEDYLSPLPTLLTPPPNHLLHA